MVLLLRCCFLWETCTLVYELSNERTVVINQQCNTHTEGARHWNRPDNVWSNCHVISISSDISRFQRGRTIKRYYSDYISCNSSASPNRQCWDIPDYSKSETASSTWMPGGEFYDGQTFSGAGKTKVRTGFECLDYWSYRNM